MACMQLWYELTWNWVQKWVYQPNWMLEPVYTMRAQTLWLNANNQSSILPPWNVPVQVYPNPIPPSQFRIIQPAPIVPALILF